MGINPSSLRRVWTRLACLWGGVLLLAACQTATAPRDTPVAPPASAAIDWTKPVTPKVNRVLFAIGPPGTEGGDPRDVTQTQNWQFRGVYEYLTGVDSEGGDFRLKVGQLATRWSLEPDGKSYRFQLRKGVPFHFNKGEFTAQDVIFSWKHLIALDSLNAHSPRYRAQIADIEVVNDYEVIIKLRAPDQTFMWNVGQQEHSFVILNKKEWEALPGPPGLLDPPVAGTGPYFIKEREQSRFMRFQRVAGQHYRRTPDFPEFEWRFIKENSTILAALLAKEVHLAALPLEMVPQAEAKGFKSIRMRAPTGPMVFAQFLGPWIKPTRPTVDLDPTLVTPLSDLRVRRALSKAINRQELNKAFLQDKGTMVYNAHFHPSRVGWNPDWERRFEEQYGYDPSAARKLLADAGYGPANPLKHTMILSGNYGYFPELKDMAEAIGNYWRTIGVDVTLDQPDPVTQDSRTRSRQNINHSILVPTSIRQFFGFGIYGAGTILNEGGVIPGASGGDFIAPTDFYLNTLRSTIDESKWDELYRQMGNMWYDRIPVIPLFWLPVYAVADGAIVADYHFSGTLTGPYADIEYIRPAQ